MLLAGLVHSLRHIYVLASLLCACGGTVTGTGGSDGGHEKTADAGVCTDGSYPVYSVGCGDASTFTCCPAGANCDPGSCTAEQHDAGGCPANEYLLSPCCGGFNDTTCSNGPGPSAPFCTAIPPSCTGKSTCTLGGCTGPLDEVKRTLECTCI